MYQIYLLSTRKANPGFNLIALLMELMALAQQHLY
jgi:hypothetical protein